MFNVSNPLVFIVGTLICICFPYKSRAESPISCAYEKVSYDEIAGKDLPDSYKINCNVEADLIKITSMTVNNGLCKGSKEYDLWASYIASLEFDESHLQEVENLFSKTKIEYFPEIGEWVQGIVMASKFGGQFRISGIYSRGEKIVIPPIDPILGEEMCDVDTLEFTINGQLYTWVNNQKTVGDLAASFADYPSKPYKGKTRYPDFKGAQRAFRDYRTRIREGMSSGPNFAGQYTVIQIGCGTSCSFVLVGNNKTGEVFNFPRGGEDNSMLQILRDISSRLIIAQWTDYYKCKREYFVLEEGGHFKQILSQDRSMNQTICKDELIE